MTTNWLNDWDTVKQQIANVYITTYSVWYNNTYNLHEGGGIFPPQVHIVSPLWWDT